MKTYLVGGAVRDELLGLPVKDKDWVVVGADANELTDLGYSQVGKGFPVFLHPQTKDEYALARLERKVASGHKGFEFASNKHVTLEEDLLRRDLTINAIAKNSSGELVDPYGGQQDIDKKLLRHVSEAFVEDPLRVLRVARFAARFAHLGFSVAPETLELMRSISSGGELLELSSERIWQEIELAMASPSPWVFVTVLRDCGALKILLPEIDKLFGVPQPVKYHPEIDTGKHILLCLEQVVKLTVDPSIRYAVLVHDVGKAATNPELWPSHVGHEQLGLDLQKQMTKRLKMPTDYSGLAAIVCEHHTKMHRAMELKASTLIDLLDATDAFRRTERFQKFLTACEADARGRTGLEDRHYPQGAYLEEARRLAAAIDAKSSLEKQPNLAPAEVIRQARIKAISHFVEQQRKLGSS